MERQQKLAQEQGHSHTDALLPVQKVAKKELCSMFQSSKLAEWTWPITSLAITPPVTGVGWGGYPPWVLTLRRCQDPSCRESLQGQEKPCTAPSWYRRWGRVEYVEWCSAFYSPPRSLCSGGAGGPALPQPSHRSWAVQCHIKQCIWGGRGSAE